MFLCMSYDSMDASDLSDIVRIGLCEASCDDDGGIRIGPDGLTDGLSRLHRGFMGDRTCIDDTGVGPAIIGRSDFADPLKSRLLQLLGDGLRFKLVDLTAKGDDGK